MRIEMMDYQSNIARITEALNAESPSTALNALARQFKAEGMTQEAMYHLFDQYRAKHQNDNDETKHDAVLDTMDFIVGYCRKGAGIFHEE